MPTNTVEDYVKRIFLAQEGGVDTWVPMGRVAGELGVTAGTATTMVKSMADADLVDYKPRIGVSLTEEGQRLALAVLRRHRLIEVFLVEALQLDWAEVHEEAERLEHAISDRVLERLDVFLGKPKADPHGSPIPSSAGKYAIPKLHSLNDCPMRKRVKIARVTAQKPSFLQFIKASQLQPGEAVTVTARESEADAVEVALGDGSSISLSSRVAMRILVRG